MRTTLYSLLLYCLSVVLLNHSTLMAQAKKTSKTPPKEYTYKIQIAAYREYSFAQQIVGLDSIGTVYMEKGDNDIYRVVMGYYKTVAEAKNALAMVEQAGYPDAYVASQESKTPQGVALTAFFATDKPETFFASAEPLPPAPAVTPPAATEQIVADKATPKTDKDAAKEDLMSNKPVPPAPAPLPTPVATTQDAQTYVVDLGTIEQIADVKLGILRDLGGEIYTSPRNHVVVGPFNDLSQASKSLTTVIKKGFDNATITLESTPTNPKPKNETTKAPKPATFKEENAPTPKNTTTELPKNTEPPKPEAQYKPEKTASDPAVTSAKTETKATTPAKPVTFLETTTTTAPSTQFLSSFVTFDAVFQEVEFDMFKVDSYDPTHETITAGTSAPPEEVERNKQLKGTKLSNSLVKTLLPAEATDNEWNYYGLYKFPIDEQHVGYIVRSGKGEYQNNNNIDLHVYSNVQQNFIGKENLSRTYSSTNMLGIVQSWLLDLNNDGQLDILSYTLEEQNGIEQGYKIQSKFNGKIWLNGSYKKAQLMNEDKLRQQLNLQ